MSSRGPEALSPNLSPEEVVDLKHRLAENPLLAKLVSVHLAIGEVETSHAVDLRRDGSYGFVKEVAGVAIDCHETIASALAMRYDEWPEDTQLRPEAVDQVFVEAISGGRYG